MSGLIIGMTPLAAILSAFVYSYWSNFSYISPLKLCSFFLILGNLLYGAALQCDSVSMVFAGRLLTGFTYAVFLFLFFSHP